MNRKFFGIFLIFLTVGTMFLGDFSNTLAQIQDGALISVSPNPATVNDPVQITITASNKKERFRFIFYAVNGKLQERYDCANNDPNKYSSVNSCTNTFTKTFDTIGQYLITGGMEDWSKRSVFNPLPSTLNLIIQGANGEQPPPKQGTAQPTIASLNPVSGPLGTSIFLSGRDLGCSRGILPAIGPTVLFSQGVNTVSSPGKISEYCTRIETVFPLSAPFQPNQNVDISVLGYDGGKSNSRSFKLTKPPPPLLPPPPPGAGGAGGVGRDCGKQYPQGQGMKNPRIYYSSNKTPIAYDGLVPCGKCAIVNPAIDSKTKITTGGAPQYTSCQFCHFFVMFKGIVDWVVGGLVPILAILMLVIGGVMFYLGGANPEFLQTGKNIIKSVVWGLIIVFGAFIIVNTILAAIGLADFKAQGFDPRNWFQFPCQINI